MASLTRTQLGLLARHEAGNALFPFSASDWSAFASHAVSVDVSGRLRLDQLTNPAQTWFLRHLTVPAGTRRAVQMVARVAGATFSNWHGPAGHVDADQRTGVVASWSTERAGPELHVLAAYNGGVETDGTSTGTADRAKGVDYRTALAVDGAVARSWHFTEGAGLVLGMTGGDDPGAGGVGIAIEASSIDQLLVSAFYATRHEYVVVGNLTPGVTVEVRAAGGAVLASAVADGAGFAVVDLLGVAYPAPHQVAVVAGGLDAATFTPNEGVWGGDEYTFNPEGGGGGGAITFSTANTNSSLNTGTTITSSIHTVPPGASHTFVFVVSRANGAQQWVSCDRAGAALTKIAEVTTSPADSSKRITCAVFVQVTPPSGQQLVTATLNATSGRRALVIVSATGGDPGADLAAAAVTAVGAGAQTAIALAAASVGAGSEVVGGFFQPEGTASLALGGDETLLGERLSGSGASDVGLRVLHEAGTGGAVTLDGTYSVAQDEWGAIAFDLPAFGGGGGPGGSAYRAAVYHSGEDTMQLVNRQGTAKQRTIRFTLRDADGARVTGIAGKAQLAINDAAAVASVNDIMPITPAGDYKLELAVSELANKDDTVRVVPFGAGVTDVFGGTAYVVDYDFSATPPALATDANGFVVLQDGSLTAPKLAANAITNPVLADGAINNRVVAANTLDTAQLTGGLLGALVDKLLGRSIAGGADGGRTVARALKMLANRKSLAGTTLTVYEEDDATPAFTITVTKVGNGPAISQVDPD